MFIDILEDKEKDRLWYIGGRCLECSWFFESFVMDSFVNDYDRYYFLRK